MTNKKYYHVLESYCRQNGLSTEKLQTQELYLIYTTYSSAQPTLPSEPGTGLSRDFETQPKPTLIYHIDTGKIEETEYTRQYLV